MGLIRQHLMLEGQMEKECLTKILTDVKAIYRKLRATAELTTFGSYANRSFDPISFLLEGQFIEMTDQ